MANEQQSTQVSWKLRPTFQLPFAFRSNFDSGWIDHWLVLTPPQSHVCSGGGWEGRSCHCFGHQKVLSVAVSHSGVEESDPANAKWQKWWITLSFDRLFISGGGAHAWTSLNQSLFMHHSFSFSEQLWIQRNLKCHVVCVRTYQCCVVTLYRRLTYIRRFIVMLWFGSWHFLLVFNYLFAYVEAVALSSL